MSKNNPLGGPASPTSTLVGWFDDITESRLIVEYVEAINRVRIAAVADGEKICQRPAPLLRVGQVRFIAAKLTQLADLMDLGE